MRVAIISGTGRPDLDGSFVEWTVTPDGEAFTVEPAGLAISREELATLVRRGFAASVDGTVPAEELAGAVELDTATAARQAIFAAAARVGEDAIRKAAARKDPSLAGPRLADRLGPYRGVLVAAALLLAFILLWQGFRFLPDAWKAALEEVLRRYVY